MEEYLTQSDQNNIIMERSKSSKRLPFDFDSVPIAMGTNITFPFLFGNGKRMFLHTFYSELYNLLKNGGTQGKEAGRSIATIKKTQTLIPCVREAVKNGIYIFDSSRAYSGSEQRLAKALCRIPREKVFLITKIDDPSQFNGRVLECFEESLQQLKTDYVDLLLLHWPIDYPKTGDEKFDHSVPIYARSWRVLEQIYKSGKAKAIGVSNFSIAQLERLKEFAEIVPMANEFECHPLCIRKELNEYCQAHQIQVFAYAALCAMDKRLQNKTMQGIAKNHNKSIAQVILRWHIQQGRIPIFGTTKLERIREYAAISDFTLSNDELLLIDQQNINYRAHPDSEHCDFTKGIWIGWENYKDCCP